MGRFARGSKGSSASGLAPLARAGKDWKTGMPKVLCIEDDAASRLLVRKLLVPAGFSVVDAADGLEGIRKARDERPDLVLVDIAIPGLDGYEVTLRLRAEPEL